MGYQSFIRGASVRLENAKTNYDAHCILLDTMTRVHEIVYLYVMQSACYLTVTYTFFVHETVELMKSCTFL